MENCEKVLSLLNEYIDGELNESDALFVRAHLEECEACRKSYEELCEIGKIFDEATENSPAELCERIMTKIKSDKSAKRRRFMKTFTGVAVAAAISLTVLASPTILMLVSGGAKAECNDMAEALAPAENEAEHDYYYSDSKLEIMDAVTEQVKFDCEADDVSSQNGAESETDAVQGTKYIAYLLDGSKSALIITNSVAIFDGKEYEYKAIENRYILTFKNETLVFDFINQAPDKGNPYFKQTEELND